MAKKGRKELRNIPHPTLGMLTTREAAIVLSKETGKKVSYHCLSNRFYRYGWKRSEVFTRKVEKRGRKPGYNMPDQEDTITKEPIKHYSWKDELRKRAAQVQREWEGGVAV